MRIRMVTANLDYNRDGDLAYLGYLASKFDDQVLFLQEKVHGLDGTSIRGSGVRLTKRKSLIVGQKGAHRAVARSTLHVERRRIRLFSAHALHVGTSGREAQDEYYRILAKTTKRLNLLRRPWIMALDGNRDLKSVARLLGGRAYHDGIVGFIVSNRVKVLRGYPDDTGVKKGWTDHPAYWIAVRL